MERQRRDRLRDNGLGSQLTILGAVLRECHHHSQKLLTEIDLAVQTAKGKTPEHLSGLPSESTVRLKGTHVDTGDEILLNLRADALQNLSLVKLFSLFLGLPAIFFGEEKGECEKKTQGISTYLSDPWEGLLQLTRARRSPPRDLIVHRNSLCFFLTFPLLFSGKGSMSSFGPMHLHK